jgi:hypothetical protein
MAAAALAMINEAMARSRSPEKTMNLPALKGGISCKRYLAYEVRSAKKLFNCGVCYHFSVGVTNFNRPEGRGIKPHCE